MDILTVNHFPVIQNQSASHKGKNAVQTGEKAAVSPVRDAVTLSEDAEYFQILQEQFPRMTFAAGTGFTGRTARNTGDNANRWAFTVSPKLLEKMRASPEDEAEYMQKLRDIERATALADNFTKAHGMKTIYCENYIDGNGQLHHMSIAVRKDELNEKLRAEARENTEKMIERVREKNKEAADKLEGLLNKAEETGELVLGDEDMRWFSSAAKTLEALQKKDDADSGEESGINAEQMKGKVGINAAKLARMLAAAKTRAQVRTVIAQIQADNTDQVDTEIKHLREQKKQFEKQLQTASDPHQAMMLQKQIARLESELQQKDNDSYRREHAEKIR